MEEKRWSYYAQVKDAVFSAFSLGILGYMAFENSWNPLGVMAALACGGVVGAGAFNRWLLGKLESDGRRNGA